jgi:competence protein ComEA
MNKRKFLVVLMCTAALILSAAAAYAEKASSGSGKACALTGTVNVNTADVKQLSMLPGIGKKKAETIIAYRDKNGDFSSVDTLVKVDGIGKKTLSKIKEYIALDGENTLKKQK